MNAYRSLTVAALTVAMAYRFFTVAALTVAIASLGIGCAAVEGPLDFPLPDRAAVVFFVDGLDVARLDELDAAGRVPNIRRRFIEGGQRFTNATVCTPTVTYANAVSLMTGRRPGRHGIVANEWFDRRMLRYVDYVSALTYLDVDGDYSASTIYEYLRDETTASVQCAVSRGAAWQWNPQLANGLDWASRRYEAVDRRVGRTVVKVVRQARHERRWPILQTYYFPGVDKAAHVYGVSSTRYAGAVENVDRSIGGILDALERCGAAAVTQCWLVSDHGQMDCDLQRRCHLLSLLRDRASLHAVDADEMGGHAWQRRRRARSADAIVAAGRRQAMVHIRGADGWESSADAALVERVAHALVAADGNAPEASRGIRSVYYRTSDGGIVMASKDGRRILECGNARSENESMPNGPSDTEMISLFESERAGDLIVFAADGWMFDSDDCSGHGGASWRERHIPMFVAGREIRAGGDCDRPVSIVDVMPTLLETLGYKDRIPANIDGESLVPLIRETTP